MSLLSISNKRGLHMPSLKFAMFGAGFWSTYQLAAWQEVTGAECVAIWNRTREKAECLADKFRVPKVYSDPEQLLDAEQLDFVDIVTDTKTHRQLTALVAEHGKSVICQKPLADSLEDAEQMLSLCEHAGVRLLVHENWRWQEPIRQLKKQLESGVIGTVFRARLQFSTSFPVFENQPFLKSIDRFILADVGVHVLDTARFLFGEAESVYCQTMRVHQEIRGEDVATLTLQMASGASVVCELSYATRWEHERFPQTFAFVEADGGSLELGPDYWIRCATADGVVARQYPPPRYGWADPAYDVVHASIVPCHQNLIADLSGTGEAETTARDNLRTLRLVDLAYRSAAEQQVFPV